MAVYHLANSPTYRQKTSEKVYRRREVVCKHLNDDYKVHKFKDEETYQGIVSELAAEKIEITKSTYQADKVLLRTAFLWLVAPNETEKERLGNVNSPSAKVGINCLIKDGIRTWADLKLEGTALTAPQEPIAPEQTPVPPPPSHLKLSECQAGVGVAETLSELVGKLEAMLTEDEKLKAEIARLSEENEQQSRRTEDLEAYIQFVEDENTALEERIKTAKEGMRHLHSASLEEIAEQSPEFPELFTIVQRMKESQNRRQELVKNLQSRLPQIFTWANDTGSIRYEQHFLHSLSELKPDEQEQVIRQLEVLAQQGSRQASLDTNKSWMKLRYSPIGGADIATCGCSSLQRRLRAAWRWA